MTGQTAVAQDESRPGLAGELEALVADADADGVRMGISVVDLSGAHEGASLTVGSEEPYKAASVIKLPLLGLLMDMVDQDALSLDQSVSIAEGDADIVGGAGSLE